MDLRRSPRNTTPSPRHLAYRHAKRRLGAREQIPENDPIEPGEEQLYSFYVPGLQAGLHTIDVIQKINASGQSKEVKNSHDFNVIGPRFSLPENAIDSFYPPQGHADRVEVLPSVVFNDPTLPWERQASTDRLPDFSRNRVPWLAVLLFTQDELRLDGTELGEAFDDPSIKDIGKKGQGSTLSITMPAADIHKLKNTNTKSVLYDQDADGKETKANVILPRAKLFTSLFAKYNEDGNQENERNCYVSHHRFLAHLRHIYLDGMPAAAKTNSKDHVYSVVVGHRTGPLSINKPTPVVAHLVNIEGVESMSSSINEKFVAMTSLHSWEYTCLPPASLDVEAAFENLGDGLSVLRPSLSEQEKKDLEGASVVGKRVKQRLQDGFSMLRYRLQTGEIGAAFSRSPFTPTARNTNLGASWPPNSTTGSKLQILDQNLNIMDLTYSAAWNLGKTLGLAHPEFSVALSRVRKQIFDLGMQEAQSKVIKQRSKELGVPSPYKTREEILNTLRESIKEIASLPERQILPQKASGMVHRWHRPEHPPLDLTYRGPDIKAVIGQSFEDAAKKIAGSVEDPNVPYNEHNTPYSTDWMIVLHWVLDRYHLADVPAHYLITDPSHLPEESLRFFTVDHDWVMAMIDGGLSLANHLDQTDDQVRDAIKWAVNWYLTTKLPGLNYCPTIPAYGFYIRSELVTKFPDLIVDLEPAPSDEYPPVILRHEVVDRGTMLCMMREPPADPEFRSLFLREPPHQQYFSAAAEITTDAVTIKYKRLYTVKPMPDNDQRTPIEYVAERKNPNKGRSIFIWGDENEIRCMNVENFAVDYQRELKNMFSEIKHPEWYTDTVPNAVMIGIQLTEPEWQLEVALPPKDVFPELYKEAGHLSRLLRVPVRQLPSPEPYPAKLSSTVTSSPHPRFGNRHRKYPVKLKYAPPHFRTTLPDHTIKPLSITGSDNDNASAPKFIYNVYPVGGKPGDPIPMIENKQDLVFSIVYETGAQDFLMENLEIRIDLFPPSQLMQQYGGPGPTMLSNLRFNVLARLSSEQDQLVLTLKPRSTNGYVPVTNIKEMSFMLSAVVVTKYDTETTVDFQAAEKYFNEPQFHPKIGCTLVPA